MEINVAFLGMGNVGCGVYNVLKQNEATIIHRDDLKFNIKKILVRDINKDRGISLDSGILTNDIKDILEDDSISLVVEVMGGINPAREYIEAVLLSGINVVTANKELISNYWPSIERCAKKGNAGMYYEASVGGGIPIIKTFLDSLQANKIEKISAIINGTTNYILTKMTDLGISYEQALSEAQAKGLAEPDPTNDVEGLDSKYKLSILASLAFHAKIPVDKIYCEGITKIKVADILYGKEFGYVVKLLAIAKRNGERIDVRVHPSFIPKRHPLASVHDAYNAIFIQGDTVGKLMLYGQGAGANPTASAIISDMVKASQTHKHHYNTFHNSEHASADITFEDDWMGEYYIRVKVNDKPGVLAKVAGAFAAYNVSVESVMQKNHGDVTVPLIFITNRASEKSIMNTLEMMKNAKSIISIESIIRVEK